MKIRQNPGKLFAITNSTEEKLEKIQPESNNPIFKLTGISSDIKLSKIPFKKKKDFSKSLSTTAIGIPIEVYNTKKYITHKKMGLKSYNWKEFLQSKV
jgi:hypothetical protein